MRTVRIFEAAAEEAAEAAAWYERQRPGLGADFLRAIDAALDLLEDEVVPLAPVTGTAAQREGAELTLGPIDPTLTTHSNEFLQVTHFVPDVMEDPPLHRPRTAHSLSGLLRTLFIATFAVATPSLGAEQTWRPDKTVEISVPGGAGGGIDTQARAVQLILQNQRIVDVPLIVVNKPGGSASVGLTYISQQSPNGLHIAMGSSALLTNHIVGRSALHYTDVTPLPQLASESIAFSVRADSPIKDGKEFLRRLKEDPAEVRVGLPSVASSNHIASALMTRATGADPKRLRIVVFNSSAAGITALLGGHIDVVTSPVLNTIPFVQQGTLRVLAVTAPKRLQGQLANVPTARELGADVVIGAYRNVLGPKGMGPDKVAYWDAAFARMVATPEWRQFMQKNSWEDNFMLSRESGFFLQERYAAFKTVLSELGLVKAAP